MRTPPRRRAQRRRPKQERDAIVALAVLAFAVGGVSVTSRLVDQGRFLEAIVLVVIGLSAAVVASLILSRRARAIARWIWQRRRRRAYQQRRSRERVAPGLRFRVFQRDGFRCTYCGRTAAASELQADHVVPVALGGRTELDNLVTSCGTCNLGKSATEVV